MVSRRLHAEDIYDAILDDEAFAALPQRLTQAFGGRSTLIHCHYANGGAQVLAHSGYFTDEQLNHYAADFAHLDPWAAATAGRQTPNRAASLEEFVSQAEYARSAFFNEYVRGMGDDTFHCMGARIDRPWGAAMLGIQRGRSQAPFDSAAVASLQQEIVHVRHLLAIRGKLAVLQRRSHTLEATFDVLPQAAILTDCSGKIVHANAAAELLLTQGDGIRVKQGMVTTAHPTAVELRDAIARASDRSSPSPATLLLRRSTGAPLLVSVTPVKTPAGARLALLMVREMEGYDHGTPKWLEKIFGLSPAEAEIACRIANGASLREIAEERRVSFETVRSQLKSIFAKLGCSRQAEIASLVKTVALSSAPSS